jgi:ketosteroid isomerase-like protein
MSNAPIVEGIYQAFGRGDVPAILGQLADDVAWDHWPEGNGAQQAGLPIMQERKGREAVLGFFEAVGGGLDVHNFQVQRIVDGGDVVIACVRMDCTIRSTGSHLVDDEVHVWEFDHDGKVVRFRHVVDTAKHVAAWGLR